MQPSASCGQPGCLSLRLTSRSMAHIMFLRASGVCKQPHALRHLVSVVCAVRAATTAFGRRAYVRCDTAQSFSKSDEQSMCGAIYLVKTICWLRLRSRPPRQQSSNSSGSCGVSRSWVCTIYRARAFECAHLLLALAL